jgi:hypothetical protein
MTRATSLIISVQPVHGGRVPPSDDHGLTTDD